MIKSFRSKRTELLFGRRFAKAIPHDIQMTAYRKLAQMHSAKTLDDLRSPPGNRLEALSGDRSGQHSIRINAQWRICFVWRKGNAYDVEIVDYH